METIFLMLHHGKIDLNVFVKEMNSEEEPVRVTNLTDRDIAGFIWKDDNILYLKDNGGDENYHIYTSTFNGAEEQRFNTI